MSYAAELIKKAREARQYPSDKAVAVEMGIDPSTLNQWKHGKGSPMPQERVLELCDLAGIKDEAERGYWLFGIQRDAVTITSVQRAIDTALDRLRPTAAVVGLLLVVVGGAVSGSMPIMSVWWGQLRQRRDCKAGHKGPTADRFRCHAPAL